MNIQRFPLGELWTNCYILWDDNKKGIIVDPGGPAEYVADFVTENKIDVAYIMLTHGHADHIGGIPDVRKLSKYGVAIHTDDACCLTNPDKNLSFAFGKAFSLLEAEKLLTDGEIVTVGNLKIEVIHTPGHTLGGVCFYVEDGADKILLCGDTLFELSIGRTDLPGGDETVLINSLRKLERFPDDLEACPGHGPATNIGKEKKYNPYWPR